MPDRARKPAAVTPVTVRGLTFTFRPTVLADLPEAPAFLDALLARGTVSPPVAANYVKLVARMKRQGRLADVGLLVHNVERTAANAYLRWTVENYDARVLPVTRALAVQLSDRSALRWVRVHALVPPYEGKLIAVKIPMMTSAREVEALRQGEQLSTHPLGVTYQPTDRWTLHVPDAPCPAHGDPCNTCNAIELNAEQLETIAAAFESAWGHRALHTVPTDAFLFGAPPPTKAPELRTPKAPDKILALATDNTTSDELTAAGATVVRDATVFVDRLREGMTAGTISGVYFSREACGARLQEVISAVWEAWGGPPVRLVEPT